MFELYFKVTKTHYSFISTPFLSYMKCGSCVMFQGCSFVFMLNGSHCHDSYKSKVSVVVVSSKLLLKNKTKIYILQPLSIKYHNMIEKSTLNCLKCFVNTFCVHWYIHFCGKMIHCTVLYFLQTFPCSSCSRIKKSLLEYRMFTLPFSGSRKEKNKIKVDELLEQTN